jgi:two-component sensor histidine kinase
LAAESINALVAATPWRHLAGFAASRHTYFAGISSQIHFNFRHQAGDHAQLPASVGPSSGGTRLLTTTPPEWIQFGFPLPTETEEELMVPCRPKFRCPQRAKLTSNLDEADDLAPAAVDVGIQQPTEANECQRVLFQELQHRVANTLHSTVCTLEIARSKIYSAPAEADNMLEQTIRRISLSADMHRCLNSPALLDRGFSSILSDAVATVIDSHSTCVSFEVDELDLSFDQISVITMIVIEIANNAQKHVFGRNLGWHFVVALRAVSDNHAALSVKDDGPGWSIDDTVYAGRTLGLSVLQGLADQLHGTLHIESQIGTETSVVFPLYTGGNALSEPNQIGRTADSTFLSARKQTGCVPDGRHSRTTRRDKRDFAFSGLITCGHCGRALVGENPDTAGM